MNPTTLELCPLRACQHLAIDQHKGLSCQALSPLPSSPGSSAGCIQSQLTDKTDLSEKLLLTLELLRKKLEKATQLLWGAPAMKLQRVPSFRSSFQTEILLLEPQLSYTAAALQPHLHLDTYPTDPNPDPTHGLIFLI